MKRKMFPLCLILCTSLYSTENTPPSTVAKPSALTTAPQTQVKEVNPDSDTPPKGVAKKTRF